MMRLDRRAVGSIQQDCLHSEPAVPMTNLLAHSDTHRGLLWAVLSAHGHTLSWSVQCKQRETNPIANLESQDLPPQHSPRLSGFH